MTRSQPVHRRPTARRRRGFTLIEVLVVIGIIVVLIGILIPVVSRVRRQAKVADVSAQIAGMVGALERYHADFKAYPGAFPNQWHGTATLPDIAVVPTATGAGYDNGGGTISGADLTMSEAMVLAMCGGLSTAGYDPAQVGTGPSGLSLTNPKKYTPYLDAKDLSWRDGPSGKTGKFEDGAGAADDSIVPEFVDRFESPLPILYIRAQLGGTGATAPPEPDDNPVITNVATGAVGQYQLRHLAPYVGTDSAPVFIGEGKKIDLAAYQNTPSNASVGQLPHGLRDVEVAKKMSKDAGSSYEYPYDAFPYFSHPTMPNTARAKDAFILISAGLDRVYGTEDDITSFGSVLP